MFKGQIFSMDFLISMTIIILGIGVVFGLTEINFYNNQQQQVFNKMKQKTETAMIILANSPEFDCNIGTVELAYSLDANKLQNYSPAELKNRLGLSEYLVSLIVDSNQIINDALNSRNIIGFDLNVAYCKNNTKITDLKLCANSTPMCNNKDFSMKTITIKVGQ